MAWALHPQHGAQLGTCEAAVVGVPAAPALLAAVPRLGGQVVQQPPLVAGRVLDYVSQPPARPQTPCLHIPACMRSCWSGQSPLVLQPALRSPV